MKKNTKSQQQKISNISRWLKTEPYSVGQNGEVLKFRMLGYDENNILTEEVFEPGNKLLRRTYFTPRDDGQFQMSEMTFFYYEGNDYRYHIVITEDGEMELVEGDDPIAYISDMCKECLKPSSKEEPETPAVLLEPSQTIPVK